MNQANLAMILLSSVQYGETDLGTPNAVAVEETIDTVVIRNQGKTGPGARGVIAKDVTVLIDFLEKGVIVPSDCMGTDTLHIVGTTSDCSEVDIDITGMMALGYSFEMNRNSPPGVWRQKFALVSDMDSDPIS